MPEGDTLYHYAQRLRPLLVGQRIRRVDARHRKNVNGLLDTVVDAVDSIGKHLLISFSDETFLRVHLGMKGTIHRYAPGQRWQRPMSAMGWMLGVDAHDVVGFFPKECERFHRRDYSQNLALSRLGPDLLKDPLDLDAVVARYRAIVRPEEAIGMGLLDQRPACGVGNIYRCETLFLSRQSPFTASRNLSDATLLSLFETATRLLRANVETPIVHPRMTTEATHSSRELFVYGQHRTRCVQCETPISVGDQSDLNREYVRRTWWCATCQPSI